MCTARAAGARPPMCLRFSELTATAPCAARASPKRPSLTISGTLKHQCGGSWCRLLIEMHAAVCFFVRFSNSREYSEIISDLVLINTAFRADSVTLADGTVIPLGNATAVYSKESDNGRPVRCRRIFVAALI